MKTWPSNMQIIVPCALCVLFIFKLCNHWGNFHQNYWWSWWMIYVYLFIWFVNREYHSDVLEDTFLLLPELCLALIAASPGHLLPHGPQYILCPYGGIIRRWLHTHRHNGGSETSGTVGRCGRGMCQSKFPTLYPSSRKKILDYSWVVFFI